MPDTDIYIQSKPQSNLIDFAVDGTNLNVDLNLNSCVSAGSSFINFGTAAPTSSTPGKIYIQI